jgi:biofilm PGA synthesis protein PgaD
VTTPSLIIERPCKRPVWARLRDWALSLLVWSLYLYMIREVFIDLYFLGYESLNWMLAGTARPSVPEIARLLQTLPIYLIVILANGWTLIIWALYNQIRFRGRRLPAVGRSVNVEDLAVLYELPAKDIAIWQNSRILTMKHGTDGTLVEVTLKGVARNRPAPPAAPSPATSPVEA